MQPATIFNQHNRLNFLEIDVFCKALITSNFIKARRANNFWVNKIEECFFNNNPELIQICRARGIAGMLIRDLKYFYNKKIEGYNSNLPIFSERFKFLSNQRQFTGNPPPPTPMCQKQHNSMV